MDTIKKLIRNNDVLLQTTRKLRSFFGYTPEVLSLNNIKKSSPALIDTYLRTASVRKLQIGCQSHPFDGWLNVDIEPKDNQIAFMDGTKPFPLPSASFDYVFTEHMIEHISLDEGNFMIGECYRVLKPGGKIRIGTPNIKFLCSLMADPTTQDHKDYIRFSSKYFKNPVLLNETVVVNNFFRDWGHKFIYDQETLKQLLLSNKFVEIRFCEVNESDDPVFQNLERHGLEITDRFNKLETIIVEATK
jgi:predicted SAM-dependent methyltransferase